MLSLNMATKVDLALKGPRTDVTGERLEASVLPAVSDEVGRLAERLATLTTLVRLLACSEDRKYHRHHRRRRHHRHHHRHHHHHHRRRRRRRRSHHHYHYHHSHHLHDH